MTAQAAGQAGRDRLGIALAGVLTAAAVLAGCMSATRPAAPPKPAPAPSAPTPAPAAPARPAAPAGGFFFNRDGDEASLAFGEPDSDAVTLFFSCKRGTRRVEITDALDSPKPGQSLTVVSDTVRSDLPIRIAFDAERNGDVASASAPTDAAALAAFRKSGRIAFGLGMPGVSLAATPGEMAAVSAFFAVCEQGPHKRSKRR